DHGASEPGSFELTILGVTPAGLVVRALWVAEFVAVPGESTGKFAGVSGGWIMIARSEPFVLRSDDPGVYSLGRRGVAHVPTRAVTRRVPPAAPEARHRRRAPPRDGVARPGVGEPGASPCVSPARIPSLSDKESSMTRPLRLVVL